MDAAVLKGYDRVLNDYHGKLLDVAYLSAHLLEESIDTAKTEWQKSACNLMAELLVELAEGLPFPGEQGAAHARSEARTDAPPDRSREIKFDIPG